MVRRRGIKLEAIVTRMYDRLIGEINLLYIIRTYICRLYIYIKALFQGMDGGRQLDMHECIIVLVILF